VVSELWKAGAEEILIGGRHLDQGKALAASFDRRVTAAALDVQDPHSLDEFCAQCSIVVNCAGPVVLLQDRVAQAAMRARCHYVDVAGMSFVKERLLPRSHEIQDLGLSFVVSAGWIPGISELLPVYAGARANTRMDVIDSVTVYFGDAGEWSDSALLDAVWYVRQVGLRGPRYLHKGDWVRAGMRQASPTVDLGARIGRHRFSMFSTPEQKELAQQFVGCDVLLYSYLFDFRTALDGTLIALLPLSERVALRLLRNAYRRARLPVGGFVVARVVGRAEDRRLTFTAQVIYEKHRDYWVAGFVPALVARMIAEGGVVRTGVHFLADAVDPMAFMAELSKAGLEQTESFEPPA
jgi:saccharopine dehydrogenase-like NADP-dependent oxidoreductase